MDKRFIKGHNGCACAAERAVARAKRTGVCLPSAPPQSCPSGVASINRVAAIDGCSDPILSWAGWPLSHHGQLGGRGGRETRSGELAERHVLLIRVCENCASWEGWRGEGGCGSTRPYLAGRGRLGRRVKHGPVLLGIRRLPAFHPPMKRSAAEGHHPSRARPLSVSPPPPHPRASRLVEYSHKHHEIC